MLFIYAAFLGTILFGISNIVIKYVVPKVNGSIPFLLLQMVFAVFLLFPVYLYSRNWVNPSYLILVRSQFWNILLSGIYGLTGFIFMIIGLEKGNASVGTIIFSTRVIFAVPLAIFFAGEIYSVPIYLLIILAFIGAITASYRKSLSIIQIIKFQEDGVRYFFGTAFFWALSDFYVRRANNILPVVDFLFIRQVVFALGSILVYYIATRFLGIAKLPRSSTGIVGTLGFVIINLFAQGFFIYAIGVSLTIATAIGTGQGVFTLLISLIIAFFIENEVLNEPLDKHSIVIRLIGAIITTLATIGVVILI